MDQTRGRTNEPTTNQTRAPFDPTRERTDDLTDDLTTVTVADAAKLLGLSAEAVRMRVKRGTLASTKIAGTVYVLLDRPNMGPNGEPNPISNTGTNDGPNYRPNVEQTALVANLREHNTDLRDEVEYLRRELDTRNEELRRKDTILMAMTQRIPEIEAPREPSEAPVTPSDSAGKGEETPPDTERRSWWRRLFEV